jgi:hypothetical protein
VALRQRAVEQVDHGARDRLGRARRHDARAGIVEAHRRDRAGVGADQAVDHGGGFGVGQAEAFLVRRLDVDVGRRQGFDLVVVRQVGRDRHVVATPSSRARRSSQAT